MTGSNSPKPNRKQVNYRLPTDLIDYIEKWHQATNLDREDIVANIIQAYKDAVGDPPKPQKMPGMPKPKKT